MDRVILVVDDDPILHEIASEILEDEGFSVLHAYDGREALQVLGAARCSLVLCDVFMPNMDGFETVQQIHARWPGLPVVMLSGGNAYQSPAAMLNTARLMGVSTGLAKPINRERLMAAINGTLAAEQPAHGGIA